MFLLLSQRRVKKIANLNVHHNGLNEFVNHSTMTRKLILSSQKQRRDNEDNNTGHKKRQSHQFHAKCYREDIESHITHREPLKNRGVEMRIIARVIKRGIVINFIDSRIIHMEQLMVF